VLVSLNLQELSPLGGGCQLREKCSGLSADDKPPSPFSKKSVYLAGSFLGLVVVGEVVSMS